MAQAAHIDVGDVPVNLTANLGPGCYVAQVRDFGDGLILYATGEVAPTDAAAYFVADGRAFFVFSVSPAIPPTWAKSRVPGAQFPVAVARTGDV